MPVTRNSAPIRNTAPTPRAVRRHQQHPEGERADVAEVVGGVVEREHPADVGVIGIGLHHRIHADLARLVGEPDDERGDHRRPDRELTGRRRRRGPALVVSRITRYRVRPILRTTGAVTTAPEKTPMRADREHLGDAGGAGPQDPDALGEVLLEQQQHDQRAHPEAEPDDHHDQDREPDGGPLPDVVQRAGRSPRSTASSGCAGSSVSSGPSSISLNLVAISAAAR